MLYLLVPRLARSIAIRYKDIFASGDISYPLLCAYIAMFILGFSSLCDLVRVCPWCQSVSTLSLYLKNFDKVTMTRAVRRMRWSILKRLTKSPTEWIFVFDTTRNPKRTQGISGQGKWGDSGGVFEGRNLLVLVAVNTKTGKTLPLECRPCIKKSEENSDGKKAWEMSLDILDEIVAEGFPKLPVVFDSWFDCLDFMQTLNSKGFFFSIELKSNRKVKINPSPQAQKHKLKTIFSNETKKGIHAGCKEILEIPNGMKGMKFVAERIIHLVSKGKKHLRLKAAGVFNYPCEHNPFACYATNDMAKSGVWLWQMSRYRWNIEVLFRNLKQNLAWGKLAAQCEEGCNVSIIIPLIIVTYLELEMDKKLSIGTLLKQERQSLTLRSIDFIKKNPNHNLITVLQNRLQNNRANKKPVNSVVEWNFNNKVLEAA